MIMTKSNLIATTLGATALTTSATGWFTQWQPVITSIVSIITVTGFLVFGIINAWNNRRTRLEQERHNREIERSVKKK